MKNIILKSVVADTKNLEMTPEIEQELNKIYEKKEVRKMKNNNKIIKSVKNLQELILSMVDFSKKEFLLYAPYLYSIERTCQMTNEGFNYAVEFLSGMQHYIPYLYEIENRKTSLKEIVNTILYNFSKCTKKLKSNECCISDYKYYSNKIVYELNKLKCLLEIYRWYSVEYDIPYYYHIIETLIDSINSCIKNICLIETNCLSSNYEDIDIIDKNLN